jgi:hypothetical protein
MLLHFYSTKIAHPAKEVLPGPDLEGQEAANYTTFPKNDITTFSCDNRNFAIAAFSYIS